MGVVGLENKLRKNIRKTVTMAYKAKANVRLVSGDDFKVATKAAVDAGIIDSHQTTDQQVCMTAETFEN